MDEFFKFLRNYFGNDFYHPEYDEGSSSWTLQSSEDIKRGSFTYTRKVYKDDNGNRRETEELKIFPEKKNLEEQLAQAVKNEDYKLAAKLKEEIESLNNEG